MLYLKYIFSIYLYFQILINDVFNNKIETLYNLKMKGSVQI